jgi:hypothetical protein
MNPIHVTIKNIAPEDEIPATSFQIQDHKVVSRARTLKLTVTDRLTSAFRIQALWDSACEKLYLVGGSSDEPIGGVHRRPPFARSLFDIAIDISPLGERAELKIYKRSVNRPEELLLTVDTRPQNAHQEFSYINLVY